MSESKTTAMSQLIGYDDAMQPVVVTIAPHETKEGPLHVGVRIQQWGSYFYLEPKVCWMDGTDQALDCDDISDCDFAGVRLTAAMAVADMLTDSVTKNRVFSPN